MSVAVTVANHTPNIDDIVLKVVESVSPRLQAVIEQSVRSVLDQELNQPYSEPLLDIPDARDLTPEQRLINFKSWLEDNQGDYGDTSSLSLEDIY